jgi:hypothetical protein
LKALFVLGGESKGLSAETRSLLHQTVSIPLAKGTESEKEREERGRGRETSENERQK